MGPILAGGGRTDAMETNARCVYVDSSCRQDHLVQVERLEMGQLCAPELDETILSGSDQPPGAVMKGVDAPLVRSQSFLEPPNRHNLKYRWVRQIAPS